MTQQKYLERVEKGVSGTLPTLTKADRLVNAPGICADRFLVQVRRGKITEVIDLLCCASGFNELRAVVKELRLGAIVNWEPQAVPF